MLSLQFTQIGFAIVCTLLLCNQDVYCRTEYGAYYLPRHDNREMNIENPYYNRDYAPNTNYEMEKIEANDPNFLPNWPYLKDLLPSSYEQIANKLNDIPNRQPQDNQLGDYDMPENLQTALPLQLQRIKPKIIQKTLFKVANDKKNSNSNKKQDATTSRKQYMHSCHFKICNMGRKRDLRFHKF